MNYLLKFTLVLGTLLFLTIDVQAQHVQVYYKKFVVPGNSEFNRWMSSPEMKRRLRAREEQMANNVSEYYQLTTNGKHSYFEYDTTIMLKKIEEERRGWWSRADIKFNYAKHVPSGNVTIRTDLLPDSICRAENFKEKYNWKLADGRKVFAGLECRKAYFVDEKGDTTLAWFSPSIPISDGPESFAGTPGIILAIEAPSFNYIAEEVQVGDFKVETMPISSDACLTENEYQEKVREAIMRKYINE